MIKFMENVVNIFSKILFDEMILRDNDLVDKKEAYVLSSVFPNTKIMEEVEKHL